jgi:hypothetical protein
MNFFRFFINIVSWVVRWLYKNGDCIGYVLFSFRETPHDPSPRRTGEPVTNRVVRRAVTRATPFADRAAAARLGHRYPIAPAAHLDDLRRRLYDEEDHG